MQHIFEYIIDHEVQIEEDTMPNRIHEYYVTESSRPSKVAKKILKDRQISINTVQNFQLRKIR